MQRSGGGIPLPRVDDRVASMHSGVRIGSGVAVRRLDVSEHTGDRIGRRNVRAGLIEDIRRRADA